jgi:hypothetical protein
VAVKKSQKSRKPLVPEAKVKPRAKGKRKKQARITWMACGFDVQLSNISGAAIAYDKTLDKFIGPVTMTKRWTKDDHYFTRLADCARSHEFVIDLMTSLKIVADLDEVFIAIEEAVSIGHFQRGVSQAMKQQTQISGALMGGLVRWGWQNVYEVNNVFWRQIVAADLEITTHYTKWSDPKMVKRFGCTPKNVGKFRAKEWVQDVHPEWNIPEFPDIIAGGPKPKDSKAKPLQADDRYSSLAIMEWMRREITEGRT